MSNDFGGWMKLAQTGLETYNKISHKEEQPAKKTQPPEDKPVSGTDPLSMLSKSLGFGRKNNQIVHKEVLALFDDSLLREIHEELRISSEIEKILAITAYVNPSLSSSLIEVGEETQKRLSNVLSSISRFSLTKIDDKIYTNINAIVSITKQISHADFELFYKNPTGKGLFFNRIPLVKQLDNAYKNMDTHISYVEKEVSSLLHKRMREIEAIEQEHNIIAHDVFLYVDALKVIKEYLIRTHAKQHLIDVTDRRLESMIQTSLDDGVSHKQIDMMRNLYILKLETINNTIIGLVNSWRGYCNNMVHMINHNQSHLLPTVAGKFLSVTEQIDRETRDF